MPLEAAPSQEQSVPAGAIDPDAERSFIAGFNPDLPHFGEITEDLNTHGQAIAYLMRIARESDEARQPRIDQASRNARIYQWGVEHEPVDDTAISNDIQTTVISISDIQTRDPFAIFIRPIQTQDKAQIFWIGPAVTPEVSTLTGLPSGLGMAPVVDPMTGQPMVQGVPDPQTGEPMGDQTGMPALQPVMQPMAGPQPIDEVAGWQLRKMAAAGAFPAEWLAVIDDRLVADVYQTVFDAMWIDANCDDWIVENVLKTNIFGYQTAWYHWDNEQKKHTIRDVSIKQAYLDPNVEGSNFDLQNCPGFDVVLDVDKAKADFPQLATLIDTHGKIGYPAQVDSTSQFGVASDRSFWRRTVTIRYQWFRNQIVPMTPVEAQDMGLIELGPNGEYLAPQNGDSTGDGLGLQDLGNEGAQSQGNQPDQSQPSPQTAPGEFGQPQTTPDDVGVLDQRPIAPAPEWPMTYGIRQMTTIALSNRITQDIRCEAGEIPMLLNVCIPLPGTPFGQGLPEKLSGLQKADIVLLNSVLTYARTFANPGSAIPQSVANALAGGLKRTHVDPTETLIFPDDLITRFGQNAVMWFEPPALPPAVPQAMSMINERTQRTSGHSEVMSGTAPSPTSSGKLVESLQNAAASQFGFQAKWTAKMVERLANLMHHSHLWRMEAEDLAKIYKRIPVELLRIVVQKARSSRWENQVDVNFGAGGTTNKKLQRALNLFAARSQTGEPVMTLQSVREEAGLDHEEESIKYRNELLNAMPTAPVAPGQEEDPSQSSASGNGNGQAASNGSNGHGRM